jgi:hypothetical protein
MTAYTPDFKVLIDGAELTDVTVADFVITSGRTDIYQQPVAGYCQLQLLNLDNSAYDFNVGSGLAVEVTNSVGTYIPIFGGLISDFTITVNSTGQLGYTTVASITALGALSKLPKNITEGVLSQDFDGDQIYALLSDFLLGRWNDLSPAQTWAAYPSTQTWATAQNFGLGEIDQPGVYELISRSASNTDLYSLCSAIAISSLGVLYEDASGDIGYADAFHRQNYLANNGYTTLDANHANGVGLAISTRTGDLRNSFTIAYDNNGNQEYTSSDLASQALYGLYAESYTSRIKKTTDAEDLADRYIALRANPSAKFQNITFVLGNPEIDDSDRDALINIFLGQPVWVQNLPSNISDGQFQGFIEGWTFRASLNNLTVTFNASPINFSQIAVKWEQVDPAERWNTLNTSLTWLTAIGAVA